jgi:hypothetical protein
LFLRRCLHAGANTRKRSREMRRSRPPFQPLPLRASAEKGYPPITDESTPHSDTAGSPPPNADAPSAAATLSLEGGLAIAQSAALRGAAALGAVGSFGAETTVQPGQPPAQQQPVGPPPLAGTSRIQSDYTNLLSLAISLEKMARDAATARGRHRRRDCERYGLAAAHGARSVLRNPEEEASR